MKIEVTLWEVVRYLSLVINAGLFVQWLKSRIVLNSFLVGKWEGDLMPSDDEDDILHCMLYVAKHKDADDTAHLYYYKENLKSNERPAKGVDRLVGYDDDPFFALNKTWKPKFIRVLHKNGVYKNEVGREHPVSYDWDCKATSLFFNQKMMVTVKVKDSDLCFSGTLRKV